MENVLSRLPLVRRLLDNLSRSLKSRKKIGKFSSNQQGEDDIHIRGIRIIVVDVPQNRHSRV